jgi:hypothetical protein
MRIILTSIIFFIRLFVLSGQSTNQDITKLFTDYNTDHLQEKIYVHLDRADHLTGEILWFKLYCVDGTMHRALDLSKIAYVEIVDGENKPLLQAKVELSDGIGMGSFYVPATLSTGTYLFRAYTSWMKNLGADFFFQQRITIVNTLKTNEGPSSSSVSAMEIKFYPEGGQLIEGIPARVAFQVLNSKGKGIDCSGAIVNQAKDTIARFKTLKFGIGSFLFTPQPGDQYSVIIKGSKYQATKSELPPIQKAGYSLMVRDTLQGKIKVTVYGRGVPLFAQLFIHTRQSIKVTESAHGIKNSITFLIDKSKLGEGISHFTVFDANNKPVCERLYFKKPVTLFNLVAETDQKEYAIRRKVQVNIRSDAGQAGELSVSIFRADSTSNENIVNNLLLTSELAGSIEAPWYYFSDDASVEQATDNLMLTHGWRRFKWGNVLTENIYPIQNLPEVRGHLIQGKIVDDTGKPMADKIGYLASPGKKIRLYVSKSDAQGRVRFQMKDFQEDGKLVAQTNYELDSLCHIEIENPFSSEHSPWKPSDVSLNTSMEDELVNRSIGMQVQDAYFEDETYFHFTKINSDSVPFYGSADEVYNLDDYTRFPVMEEVMREYVKGVWVRKKRDKFRFMVIDKPKNSVFEENPLTLLDGVPVFNINQVLDMDPLKIKKIEVLTRRYFLGPLDMNGLVSLSTYNGDLGGLELDPRSIKLNYEGLQKQREFYSPRYPDAATRNSRLPDQRFLLHWKPSFKIKSEAKFDFYTSDVEGQFIVVVEGLSKGGLPGYSTTSFKVSR